MSGNTSETSKLGCRKCDAGIEHRACELYDKTVTPPEGEAATEQVTPKYTNRHGEPCSEACGQGRHAECTETFQTCNCTFRGLHKTMHRYATIPAPVVSTAAPEPPFEVDFSIDSDQRCRAKKQGTEAIQHDGLRCSRIRNHSGLCRFEGIPVDDPEPAVAPESYKPAPKEVSPVVAYTNRFGVMAPMCTFGCTESKYDRRCVIHRPAATPVTVEAPEGIPQEFISSLEKKVRADFNYPEGGIILSLIAEIKKLRATPKPIGDVEAAAKTLYEKGFRYEGPVIFACEFGVTAESAQIETIAAILSPFFAPAPPCSECATLQKQITEIAEAASRLTTVAGIQESCVKHHSLIKLAILDSQTTFKDTVARKEAECATLRKERDDAKANEDLFQREMDNFRRNRDHRIVQLEGELSAAEAQLSKPTEGK